ncbi:Major Facilitator Superfamily protein [Pseudomonas taetrolens]|uniref:MFS transporter n=1 Tax=Pseudomonas taetrolens TaxID=47884 RepID=A0A0J6JFI2_PSETA|nr:MFS transporter [Pseudomonas taetrolens]KMM82562.1 MFS transporter [Pseudomonas taetrolens]SED69155.1 Major Facilitator Superfamily protein [Pseudomonas taetrolens]SQF88476.1 membrane protein [Pseudomonas taetrolens]VEH51665.1 membrane protein [Pseudomonas taetrolens]
MNSTCSVQTAPPLLTWVQLFAACLTGILIPLCFTGPAVVLSSISAAMGGSAVELSWVVNAYILTYGSAMMAAGSLTDIYGRKRVWLMGLVIFVLSTLAIPFSSTVVQIDILRLVQGLGGAAAFAGAMSSLAQVFHGSERTRVFSLLGTTFGIGLAFGPLAAGLLVDSAGWKWTFHATALIGVVGFVLVCVSATESKDPANKGMDWPGALSFTAALTLFTYGILLAPEDGWASPIVLGSVVGAILLFMLFVLIERRTSSPMLDLSLFKQSRFVGVQILAASPAFFFVVLIIMLPARFIGVEGLSALQTGQMMIALAAPLLLVPFLAAQLARHYTSGMLSAVGLMLVAVGLFWLGVVLDGGVSKAVMPMVLIGIGIGLPWGLMDGMAVSVVEKERAGMATGIFNAVRVSADGIAIAVAGALLATFIQWGLFDAATGFAPHQIMEASSRAALGDLQNANSQLPGQSELLRHEYANAFRHLLFILGAGSVLTAVAVFATLGRVSAHDHQSVERVSPLIAADRE